MNQIDIEKFRLLAETAKPTEELKYLRHKPGQKFFAGPVPWDWLTTAAKLPGRALHVGIVLWFLKKVKKSNTVHLSGVILRDLGVGRQAGYRALKALEKAGLIFCERGLGKRPTVTILSSQNLGEGAAHAQ